ncbi:MAG: ANTAR domain-containing protein [Eubacteriales bacterium]|nr:ANTAR domain-containing protein [Eubacteriales bacterium]
MERVLIVSATEKSRAMLGQFLSSCGVRAQTFPVSNCAQARRALIEDNFSLVLINAPLSDEFGHELAQTAAHDTLAGVILIVKAESADEVAERVEEDGVFVVSKPLAQPVFLQALRMIRVSQSRLTGLQSENRRLQKRIEDIRLVDRAKCVLIECCAMTEPEAHAYIERQAMRDRLTKREIAERILGGGQPE